MRILIVEDEPDIADSLKRFFVRNGFVADWVETIDLARNALRDFPYDLILIDRMLPDGDGIELIQFCRKNGIETRFLVLSALDQIEEKVKGLDLGADDYVLKPVDFDELLARVRASLRRPISLTSVVKRFGDVSFEESNMNFTVNEETVVFRRAEGLLLAALMRSPGRVVTRASLENALYGFNMEIASNSLEAQMSRLRKSLSAQGSNVQIKTVRGVGYVLSGGA